MPAIAPANANPNGAPRRDEPTTVATPLAAKPTSANPNPANGIQDSPKPATPNAIAARPRFRSARFGIAPSSSTQSGAPFAEAFKGGSLINLSNNAASGEVGAPLEITNGDPGGGTGIPPGGTGNALCEIDRPPSGIVMVAEGTDANPGGAGGPLGGTGSTTGGTGVGPGGTARADGASGGAACRTTAGAGGGGGAGIASAGVGITSIKPQPGHLASRPTPVSAA